MVAGDQQSFLVMLGLGAGQFAAPSSLVEGGTGSQAFEFADLDADGFTDLVAHTFDPAGGGALLGANVFYGNGALPYARSSAVPIGPNPRYLDLADLDLDGDLDVVLWREGGRRPQVIESLGARTFAPGVDGELAPLFTRGYVADVNGDGLADLVDGRRGGAVSVARNLGQLQFAPRTEALALGGEALTFFDEDGDGITDCVAERRLTPFTFAVEVALFRGTVAGVDYVLSPAAPIEQGLSFLAAYALDAAGGEAPELLVVDAAKGRLVTYDQADAGSLSSGQPEVRFEFGDQIEATVYEDFTDDGHRDILLFRASAASIDVMAGDGLGGFSAPRPVVSYLGSAYEPAAIDIDIDGRLDLVWTDRGHRDAFVTFGLAGGGLSPVASVGGSTSNGPVAALDYDGDGDRDLVFAQGGRIEVAEQLAGRQFAPRSVLLASAPRPGFFVLAVAEDVDLDGDDDLVYIDELGSLQLSLSDGAGGLAPATFLASGHGFMRRFDFADVDLDGDRDVVGTFRNPSSSMRQVGWFENRGGPVVPTFIPRSAGVDNDENATYYGELLDLDLDGDLDLITTSLTPYVSISGVLSEVGKSDCSPLVSNSTGQPGLLRAVGSTNLALNRLTLAASQLPPGVSGFFIASQTGGQVTQVPGSSGTLCLGGAIGRFAAPAEIRVADSFGRFALELDLQRIPTPNMGASRFWPGKPGAFRLGTVMR